MASKSGKEKLIDEEQEILQAVVLADSWNRRFRPLTTKKPRVRSLRYYCAEYDWLI